MQHNMLCFKALGFFYRSLGFAVFLTLTACGQQAGDTERHVAAESYKPPSYLRLPLDGAISTLDPGLAQSLDAIELAEQLFLGLTDFDPETYTVVPELATRWTVSENGLRYVFDLRRDAFWSDGRAVVADDLVWAIQRNLHPDTQAPAVGNLLILKNAAAYNKGEITDANAVGVRALHKYRVEFTLENPAAYFPAVAGLPTYRPLPSHVMTKQHQYWTEPRFIVSNASYKVKEWQKGSVLILERNPKYYGVANVQIPEVRYYIVPESSLGLAMYENNELDILGEVYLRIPLVEQPRIRSSPILRREYHVEPLFCTETYGFNTRQAPMDNPALRKAIIAAVNRQLIIDFVVKGHEPAKTFTRPPVFGAVSADAEIGIGFQIDQAKQWLQKAGYQNGSEVPPLNIVLNQSETHESIAKAVQTLLKEYLDITVNIRTMNFDRYVDNLFEPEDTHLFRLGWCGDYPDANGWLYEGFHPEKSGNFVGWDNQKFAELVEQAQQINDAEKRLALYRHAESILVEEEAVILPIYFSTASYLVKPWVKDWYGMSFGGQQIRNWKLQHLGIPSQE